MPKEPVISVNEKRFLLEALDLGLRMDGRKLEEFRDLDITFGGDYGVVDVSLGQTRVLVRISIDIGKPFEDRPYEGMFVISTEMSPMAAPWLDSSSISNLQENLLVRIIEKAIRRSNALDTESLCIIAGKKCWIVRADVHILDHDGNLADAVTIAVITALLHFKRPEINIDPNTNQVKVYSTSEKNPVPLNILHIPINSTFAFYPSITGLSNAVDESTINEIENNDDDINDNINNKNNNNNNNTLEENKIIILCDPNIQEERLLASSLSITINKDGEICQLIKAGGVEVPKSLISRCIEIAFNRAKNLTNIIQERIKKDSNTRDPEWLVKLAAAENSRL